jgi:hypothetical protein
MTKYAVRSAPDLCDEKMKKKHKEEKRRREEKSSEFDFIDVDGAVEPSSHIVIIKDWSFAQGPESAPRAEGGKARVSYVVCCTCVLM